MNLNNHHATFRENEASQLFAWIKARESASIVGVSGVGKSNLFNHILDPGIQESLLGESMANVLLVRVNFHFAPDFSDRTIYSLILGELELVRSEKITSTVAKTLAKEHKRLLEAKDDRLVVQYHFRRAINYLVHDLEMQLVFLFDQFDDVYLEADSRLLANLRGLRESYKYRIMYILFTRNRIDLLASSDAVREEFRELLSSSVLILQPYSVPDSQLLIKRISQRVGLEIGPDITEELIQLSGGHAGLLRVLILQCIGHNGNWKSNCIPQSSVLIRNHNIYSECEKIWQSLNAVEQRVLSWLVLNSNKPIDSEDALYQVSQKGLLAPSRKSLFSVLFEHYVREQEPLWEHKLFLDDATRQVYVEDRPVAPLTALEYRLLKILDDQSGLLVSRDELVESGWPDAKGGVSDEALTAALSRLRRKLEPEPDSPRLLITVHGQGYKLNDLGRD